MFLDELINRAVRKAMRETRVAMPARIVSYNAGTRRAQVQILQPDRTEDGQQIPQPIVTEVPVFMPIGGGASITTPIGAGDTGIVMFADQDIGGWVADGDTSGTDSGRRHSLNDAMFMPGDGRSAADASNVIITFGGATIKITPGGDVDIDAPGNVSISSAGDVTISAGGAVDIQSADLTHNGVNVGDDHVHGGITPGGANTAGPE